MVNKIFLKVGVKMWNHVKIKCLFLFHYIFIICKIRERETQKLKQINIILRDEWNYTKKKNSNIFFIFIVFIIIYKLWDEKFKNLK